MSEESSPSRLRAKLMGARGEAVLQRAPELQAHMSAYGITPDTLLAAGNAALSNLLTMTGCPVVDLNGAQDAVEKQMLEIANFCRELLPVAKYLSAFSTCQAIVARTDEAALEEFKTTVAKFMEETPFHVAQENSEGRLLMSYCYNEAIANFLLESEGMKAALQANVNTLANLTSQGININIVKACVEAGAPINNVAVNYESFLSGILVNYDIDTFKWAVSKSEPEHLNFERTNYGWTIFETALRNGYTDKALVLAEAGADFLKAGTYSSTPISALMSNSDYEFIGRFLAIDKIKPQIAPKLNSLFGLVASNYNSCPSDDFLTCLKNAGAAVNETVADCTLLGARPALSTFVSNGYAAPLRKLIEMGADVKSFKPEGEGTLLHIAQTEEIVDILLAAGVEHPVNAAGNTPAMQAVANCCSAVLPKLLPFSKIDTVNTSGQTILHIAVATNNVDFVRTILTHEGVSAIIDARCNGYTAFLTACIYNNVDIVQALLDAGADVHAVADDGSTALILVYNSPSLISMLLPKAKELNARDSTGRTALWRIANAYSVESLTALLDAGADARIHDNDNASVFTAYISGSCPLDMAMFTRLLDATDATVARTSDGATPALLLLQIRNGQDLFPTIAAEFMTRGLLHAKLHDNTCNALSYLQRNATNSEGTITALVKELLAKAKAAGELDEALTELIGGDTCLHYAAYRGSTVGDAFNNIFTLFLDEAPHLINAVRSTDGRTLLAVAAAGNNPGAITILLDRGANLEIKDNTGIAPIDLASSTQMFASFIAKGAKINWETFNAILLNDDAFVELVKDQIADLKPSPNMLIAAVDTSGDNRLTTLVNKGLEEKTLNVNAEVGGQTAVHRVAYAGNYVDDTQYTWMQKFIAAGADVNLVRTDGATPLIEAVRGTNRGALKLLLEHPGIEVNKIAQGETALTYAVKNGRALETIQLLLEKGADKKLPNAEGKFAHELTTDDSVKAVVAL